MAARKHCLLLLAFNDILDGLRRWPLWLALSIDGIRQVFKRTMIGMLWFAISFAILLGAKLVIFSNIATRPFEYYAIYLALGLFAWELLSMIIMEGCIIFSGAMNWISGVRLPLSTYAYISLCKLAIQSAYKALPVAIVFVWFGHALDAMALAVIPAILVIFLNGVAIQLFLGAICARFRDLQMLTSSVIKVMFFLSPVLWTIDQLGRVGDFLWWNPFFHFIEILRAPLLDRTFPTESWVYVGVFTILFVPIGLATFARARRHIPFWV